MLNSKGIRKPNRKEFNFKEGNKKVYFLKILELLELLNSWNIFLQRIINIIFNKITTQTVNMPPFILYFKYDNYDF